MTTDSFEHDEIEQPITPGHRSGFVAVVGRPNAGKSTLMNALLGEKLAIVSPRPQTTRGRQLGILTRPDAQVIFVDTPGVHAAQTPLGEYMVAEAVDAVPNADVVLFLVDASREPDDDDQRIAAVINKVKQNPVVLALNKIDLLPESAQEAKLAAFRALSPAAQPIAISAARGDNLVQLFDLLISLLPEGPRFYPTDQLTDTQLRDNVAEVIREKILLIFKEEIPHAVAVVVDEFKERSEDMTYIEATIYVEKDSQKGILIGHKGAALKKIGESARPDLEEMLGTRVYLSLWVKVLKNWRRDAQALKRFGYTQKT
jgi:GTP-binding protein Era